MFLAGDKMIAVEDLFPLLLVRHDWPRGQETVCWLVISKYVPRGQETVCGLGGLVNSDHVDRKQFVDSWLVKTHHVDRKQFVV